MTMYERRGGGDFDPVSATVFRPCRVAEDSGEATAYEYEKHLTTRIKSPRGLFVFERQNQGHAQATSDVAIEVRSEAGGDKFVSAMFIKHRGRAFQIKSVLRQDYRFGTTIYQCTEQNDFLQCRCR